VFTIGVFGGPLLGTIVLLLTDSSFAVVNLVAAVMGAVLLPWMAAALRLLYGDRVAAERETVQRS
jgi:uncharacterized membrane protein YeaQ/YmgE (transglycosylase-associated protein family)